MTNGGKNKEIEKKGRTDNNVKNKFVGFVKKPAVKKILEAVFYPLCSVGLIFICPAAVKRRDVILPLCCGDYFTVLTMPSQEEMPMVLR